MLIERDYDACLHLKTGERFYGFFCGEPKKVKGEICFTSAITGYQESLTDPSYAGQILTFAFPYVGNVGCNTEDMESHKSHLNGFVAHEVIPDPGNHRSDISLRNFVQQHNLTGVCGIDTRELIQIIRKSGPQNVVIAPINDELDKQDFENNADLFKLVTAQYKNQKLPEFKKKTKKRVVILDCGLKLNIPRMVETCDVETIVLPYQTSFDTIMRYDPDGFVLSNGPGDPNEIFAQISHTIQAIISTGLSIFGICLGHQILALHFGGQVEKLFQGHRGINHPVHNLRNNSVQITTQNHGYAVTKSLLPAKSAITFTSLLDNSVEGLKYHNTETQFIESVQFHPEACPGTNDAKNLFKNFVQHL